MEKYYLKLTEVHPASASFMLHFTKTPLEAGGESHGKYLCVEAKDEKHLKRKIESFDLVGATIVNKPKAE